MDIILETLSVLHQTPVAHTHPHLDPVLVLVAIGGLLTGVWAVLRSKRSIR